MVVGRFVAWLCLGIALFSLGWDIVEWIGAGTIEVSVLGEQWFRLHKESLGLVQAGIQRHLFPWLWDPILQTVILWPGWISFGVMGSVLMWLFRRRRKSRRSIG
ncbi:MAG: hypothetical protein O3C65_08970 [Proteobacteria bacterium]|nr:hypothetical protein [Pseudomonadota bacterium]MDA1058805.1 hypothetical protein [Pseudomonadota bacterium]